MKMTREEWERYYNMEQEDASDNSYGEINRYEESYMEELEDYIFDEDISDWKDQFIREPKQKSQ